MKSNIIPFRRVLGMRYLGTGVIMKKNPVKLAYTCYEQNSQRVSMDKPKSMSVDHKSMEKVLKYPWTGHGKSMDRSMALTMDRPYEIFIRAGYIILQKAQKPPVVVMHGLFGSKNNWNSLSKVLNQQTTRKIITIDARNHGDSPHHPEMTYGAMSEDIKYLLNDLDVNKSVLIGHSMGGAVVMLTALNYPSLVEKLVVVDMSPVKTSPTLHEMSEIFTVMASVEFQDLRTLSQTRKHVDKILSSTIGSSTLRQFLLTNIIEKSPGVFAWRINLPVLTEYFSTHIARFPQLLPELNGKTFNQPTLFIAGEKSDYIQKEDHAEIKKLFPSAKFVYIENAGHWLHAEKPIEFLKICSDFINQ